MPFCDNTIPNILRLPDEILLEILGVDAVDVTSRHAQIANLRLACRRFCSLTSHLLIQHSTTVDISRPVTLRRLSCITKNPLLAEGVSEVRVRVHFYHPWIADSLGNFVASVKSEWQQRLQRWACRIFRRHGKIDFDTIIHHLLENLASTSNEWSTRVLEKAYQAYRNGFDAQHSILGDGQFPLDLARTISKLPNVTKLVIHDGELNNNWNPGTRFRDIDSEDRITQDDALFNVLSRPMLWEDARWIRPRQQISAEVPINLLVDIPLGIAQVGGIVLDQFSINVSAAPNWTQLTKSPNKLIELSAAIKAMDVFQFSFQPRCRSACGPWEIGANHTPLYTTPSEEELQAINQYLSALLNAKCICYFEVNLGEFWFSIGADSITDVPHSLGADLSWPADSNLQSVNLVCANVTLDELERLAKALPENSDFDLCQVYLRSGLWSDALEVFRRELQTPRYFTLRSPVGGEVAGLDQQQIHSICNCDMESGLSRAARFVNGEDMINPFQP